MSIINRLFKRSAPAPAPKVPRQRNYGAIITSRFLSDWATSNVTADTVLRWSLETLRSMCRSLEQTNPHVRRFLQLLQTNVIGSEGITLTLNALDKAGKPDRDNKLVTDTWWTWAQRGNCTADGSLSLIDALKMILRSVARDGEVFIRQLRGFDNQHRYALQILEADMVPCNMNGTAGDNVLRMGIEYDTYGRVVAYHMYTKHPGELLEGQLAYGDTVRIPADQIIHLFIKERPTQGRGVPWYAAAIPTLRHMDKYIEASVIGARIGAGQMGFLVPPQGEEGQYEGDDKETTTDSDGNVIEEDIVVEVEPGIFRTLPAGYDVKDFKPNSPNVLFADFNKALLRTISCGMTAINYNSLAGDLESVNYSSLRQGALEERAAYKDLQTWIIETLLARIYPIWLETQLMIGTIPIPMSVIEKYSYPIFRPRRFDWVDPMKDISSEKIAIDSNMKTLTESLAANGRDFEETMTTRAAELARMKELGLIATPAPAPAPVDKAVTNEQAKQ